MYPVMLKILGTLYFLVECSMIFVLMSSKDWNKVKKEMVYHMYGNYLFQATSMRNYFSCLGVISLNFYQLLLVTWFTLQMYVLMSHVNLY